MKKRRRRYGGGRTNEKFSFGLSLFRKTNQNTIEFREREWKSGFFYFIFSRLRGTSCRRKKLPMDATGPPDARELAAFSELEGKLVEASRRVKTVRMMEAMCERERGKEKERRDAIDLVAGREGEQSRSTTSLSLSLSLFLPFKPRTN